MKEENSRWFALLIVLSAPLLSVIDVFIINIAIPAIREGVHASEGEVQLVIAGYLLGYASFLITGGRFGDHYGKKKVFMWGMAFFSITSCWCGLSHSAIELNTARFFQGLSASFMVPQTISFIQVLFTNPLERTKAIGWYGFTLGLASILGQFLGGYLTYYHFFIPGWRLIFFINLPIGVFALIAAQKYLRETPTDSTKKFDFSGVFILTFSLLGLILPLVEGRELGWPWWSWATIVGALLLFCFFIIDQRKKKREERAPLIDISLFAHKDFNLGLICVLCFYMVHNSYLLTSTLLFQNGFKFNAFLTGKIYVLFGFGSTIASLYGIKLVRKYGKRVVQAGVLIMFLCLLTQILLLSRKEFSMPVLCIAVFFHGIATGCIIPSILNVTLQSVPNYFAGAASGVYTTSQQASSALGISLIAGLFFTMLNNQTDFSHYFVAFKYASIANLFALAVMSILLLFLPNNIKSGEHVGE